MELVQVEKNINYKIMVFSWNTQSVGLCETINSNIAEYNRLGAFTTWRYTCTVPDFFEELSAKIKREEPDIIVIGFQEDRFPGSYFHSHLLPEEMPKLGYDLIKRSKLMGLGMTSYKGMMNLDPYERGIRMSIYAKQYLKPIIENEETEMRQVIGNDGQDEYICSSIITRGKGAIAAYLILPGVGRIAFVCCHLPFDSKSLIKERESNNRIIRQNALNQSNECFNNIIEHLVLNRKPTPINVIYFGDFNYRVADYRSALQVAYLFQQNSNNREFITSMYLEYDELKNQMDKHNIYKFSEGIDNIGPTFLPTCKMSKERRDNNYNNCIWKVGKYCQRVPSWCDRILYQKFGNDGWNLTCSHYNRFDLGNVMAKSDHAAVIGIYNLTSN